jgi:transcription antitermination factor NusG
MPTTRPTKRPKLTKEKRSILEDFLVKVIYKMAFGKDVKCKEVMDAIKDTLRSDPEHDFFDIKEHIVRTTIIGSNLFDASRRGLWGLTNQGKQLAERLVYQEETEGIGEDIKNYDVQEDLTEIEFFILKTIYILSKQIEGQKVRSDRVIREVLKYANVMNLSNREVCLSPKFVKYVGLRSKKVSKPSFGFWGMTDSAYAESETMFPDVVREKYWVTVELSTLGEQKLEEGDLERIIRGHLKSPKIQLFIPSAKYMKKDALKSEIFHLIQGYIFVSSGLPLRSYLDLEECPYVSSVFYDTTFDGQIHLKLLSNKKIQDMRDKLDDMVQGSIKEGETVRINSGLYQNVDGRVLSVQDKDAYVEVSFKSMIIVVKLPKIFLESIVPVY